jgi:hypothetical protein
MSHVGQISREGNTLGTILKWTSENCDVNWTSMVWIIKTRLNYRSLRTQLRTFEFHTNEELLKLLTHLLKNHYMAGTANHMHVGTFTPLEGFLGAHKNS